MDMRRILEIGPGIRPMHHRKQGGAGLELDDNEDYTGLDQPHAIQDMVEHEIWKAAKNRYGERAHIIQGDRTKLDVVADTTFDELVCLGAFGKADEAAEFDRVLTPGGILRLGTGTPNIPELMSTWGVRLQQLGYEELTTAQLNYDYGSNDPEAKRPYTVVSFRKKKN